MTTTQLVNGERVPLSQDDLDELAQSRLKAPAFATAAEAIAAMQVWIERAETVIDGGVSGGEQKSYDAKYAEALAWEADPAAVTPILSAELAITQPAGIDADMADLVAKVKTNATKLSPIMGDIAGLRRATEAAFKAEELKPDFDPMNLQTILNGAIVQAIALAGARGITLEP